MQKHSNLELNSYLTLLTERWDEFAAQAVVNTFHNLPLGNTHVRTKIRQKNDASVTGYTSEIGNVTINGDEVKVKIIGEKKETVARVGHYKVKRIKYKYNTTCTITWEHFWASGETTRNIEKPPNPIFHIEYRIKTLEPLILTRHDFSVEKIEHQSFGILLKETLVLIYYTLMGKSARYEHYIYKSLPTVIFKKEE